MISDLELDNIKTFIWDSTEYSSLIHKIWHEFNAFVWYPLPRQIRTIQNCRPCLIHAHFGPDGVAIYPVAKKLSIPLIITLHGYDINIYREWWENGLLGWRNRFYPRRLLQMGREGVYFIAVSHAIRQRAIEYGLPPEQVTVRYIGIDTQDFLPGGMPISQRAKRILFVGRLVEKKGCETLIRAYYQVRKRVRGAELIVVGDGPLRSSLEALARNLVVPVQFLGRLSSYAVRMQMDQARVFCLPSARALNGDDEGFGIVILESQACGVPVVSSAFGGATEGIIDGITGFSFPEKNVDILAQRLFELLIDDRLAEGMSAAGPKFVGERFDIRKCTKLLESYYDEISTNWFTG